MFGAKSIISACYEKMEFNSFKMLVFNDTDKFLFYLYLFYTKPIDLIGKSFTRFIWSQDLCLLRACLFL